MRPESEPQQGCLEDIAVSDKTAVVMGTTAVLSLTDLVKLYIFELFFFWCAIKYILFYSIFNPTRTA